VLLCEVHTGSIHHIGFLYVKTSSVVVLLNSIVDGADLGPMQSIRDLHYIPEASICVIPTGDVTRIVEYGDNPSQ
jgi:hypothetical protein